MAYVGNSRDAQQTPLYDTLVYTAAPQANRLTFFDTRTATANGNNITNMSRAGLLPAPNRFTVFGLAFNAIGCGLADIVSFQQLYSCRLWVGNKIYIEAPMDAFPCIGGAFGSSATAATSAYTNGVPDGPQSAFALGQDYGIAIESMDPFVVELFGPTGFTPAAGGYLRSYLLGVYEKPVQ